MRNSATPLPGVPGQVERADDPRLAVDVADQLALVPDMVAHGEHVGAGVEELVGDGAVMPKPAAAFSPLTTTASSLSAARSSAAGSAGGAAGAPDDVADKENPHALSLRAAELDGRPR